jgi:hypothetical protein
VGLHPRTPAAAFHAVLDYLCSGAAQLAVGSSGAELRQQRREVAALAGALGELLSLLSKPSAHGLSQLRKL